MYKYKLAFLFISFLLLGILNKVEASSQRLDLNCLQRKILDPKVQCEGISDKELQKEFVDSSICRNAGKTCNYNQACIRTKSTGETVCLDIYKLCPACMDKTNGNCMVTNPLEDSSVDTFSGYTYECVLRSNEINIFGINMGTPDVAIPKLIRLWLSFFFGFIGIVAFFVLFSALWTHSTSRNQEAIENTQKTIQNALVGIGLAVASVVIVQLISQLFGIQGDLFDLSVPMPEQVGIQ